MKSPATWTQEILVYLEKLPKLPTPEENVLALKNAIAELVIKIQTDAINSTKKL